MFPLIDDLVAARMQMALSLGWHIVVACLGVGFPLLVLLAEWRWIRSGDEVWRVLARRWAKGLAVVFAVGAVSGTILSFEMGILWPGLMGTFGEVIGLPFAIEGIAFFIEAIFLGIYLFAWDRLPPRAHLLSGIPIVLAGVASAFFVVTANAWMQQPQGFDLVDGRVVEASPWEAMFNPATPHQTAHMILAAFMVSGFLVATVYAAAWLRGKRDDYHRRAFRLSFAFAAIATPVQIGVGDWAAHTVASHQPVKLAAMEGVFQTEDGAALRIGGIVVGEELRYAIEIPNALSLLAYWDPNATVVGLAEVPEELRPPVGIVHWAFDIMVGIGFALLALALWFAVTAWRRRRTPTSRWFHRFAVLAGPAAVVALEAGWIVTEVGRQPWIVYGYLLTEDAVNPTPGLRYGLYGLVPVYLLLTVGLVYVLRRLARAPFERANDTEEHVGDYPAVESPP
ncbi:cytochrome ubiquinol oxidase subunit I [Geodermatophilus sp. SYSU D01186]